MIKYITIFLMLPFVAMASTAYEPIVTPIKYDFDPEIMLQVVYPNKDGVQFTRPGEEQCFSSKISETIPCEEVMLDQLVPQTNTEPEAKEDDALVYDRPEWQNPPKNPEWVWCCSPGHPTNPPDPVEPEMPPVPLPATGWLMMAALGVFSGRKLANLC